ncbi:YitT family protein [Alkalihalobacillus sp. AL-G]|uniref:YczE/YyaS/YitT family protein n=1 Tax=Alkalihalobacillus sp. AL-G TaxID=2926399 RepID=UPI00272ADC86|nr:hypothetical protein [Alkalihalobacillus sp. AL-G]WLD94702.1 hypothetical protein MOJ78_07415 [Alkalihalobacillus sp. AL-G]
MRRTIRPIFFLAGLIIFSYGIATAIKVQYLGLHPWDVLNIAMFERVGLTIGSWAVIIGGVLVAGSLLIDRSYISIGTFLNAFFVGVMIDLFLFVDFFPPTGLNVVLDILVLFLGITLMGIGGGVYNSAGVGAGPRDGFMLSISDKTGLSISRVRIITESGVLVIGWLLGGPVFVFTFIYTFIQSPIFQATFLRSRKLVNRLSHQPNQKEIAKSV